MQLYYIFFSAFLELIILRATKADIPGCHFWETVNISSSQPLQNGSYLYQGLLVPDNLIGEYNNMGTELEYDDNTEGHLRGCVCHLRTCIWICCRFIDWDTSNGKCTDGLMEELRALNPSLKVTLSNGSIVKRDLLKDFIVLRDQMRILDTWKEANFTLFENGSVLLEGRNVNEIINSRGYNCIHPHQFSSGNTDTFAFARHKLFYFAIQSKPSEVIWASEVFLILTIAVYLYVKKLRNLHGKCFICYMVTSFIFFIYMSFRSIKIPFQLCALYAYSYYFMAMAKFTWLLSLSHQMWRGFTSLNRTESQHTFRAYSIFSWGMAALLTGIIFLIDFIWADNPSMVNWIPGVGWEHCDIKSNMTFLYINCPLNTLIALNTVFFIWTTVTIIRVKLSLKHLSHSEDTARDLSSRMQTYAMYIRLFIAMDIQWSVRFISMFSDWMGLYVICLYCDYCLGIIIFVLFILKRSTIVLLMESIRNGQ